MILSADDVAPLYPRQSFDFARPVDIRRPFSTVKRFMQTKVQTMLTCHFGKPKPRRAASELLQSGAFQQICLMSALSRIRAAEPWGPAPLEDPPCLIPLMLKFLRAALESLPLRRPCFLHVPWEAALTFHPEDWPWQASSRKAVCGRAAKQTANEAPNLLFWKRQKQASS